MSLSIPYYVYKIVCLSTRQYYFGYRIRNARYSTLPEHDLWKRYFTSSPAVKSLITRYGKDNFESQILFTSFDIDECYWHEQILIRDNWSNPLLLNSFYHNRELGHKVFRAEERECQHCNKVIGSGNIDRHEISCSKNPNRQKRFRPQTPCRWCGESMGPGGHEMTCAKNPDRTKLVYSKTQTVPCQHCQNTFSVIAIRHHEDACKRKLSLQEEVICAYCHSALMKKDYCRHLRQCETAIQAGSRKQIKLVCEFCRESVGSCAIERHKKACAQNPQRTVTPQAKETCHHCQKLFGAFSIIKHMKTCAANGNAVHRQSPRGQCSHCSQNFGLQVLGRHERACSRALFCDTML